MHKHQKRLLVIAGGTGGHVFPALAVAKTLAQQGWRILWVGTPDRMEASLVPQHGFDIQYIDIQGIRGNGIKRLIRAPFKILSAILQSRKIIRHFQPDAALGMGGFVSGPAGIAAWLQGVPLILHEQNAVPGFTNKVLARFASATLTAFPCTLPKATAVGNPVRSALVALHHKPLKKIHSPLRILVVGGSLGAQIFNDILPEAVKRLKDQGYSVEVWHQVGKHNDINVIQSYELHQVSAQSKVMAFIDDMAAAYAWADIAICRAGALTVSELAVIGMPSILVPLPHAVDDHQSYNARTLEQVNASILMPQSHFSAYSLSEALAGLCERPQDLQAMQQAAKSIATLDAAEQVAQICQQWAKSPTKEERSHGI